MKLLAVLLAVLFCFTCWAVLSFVMAVPFMLIWNYAITHAFHAPELGYWHAYWLLIFGSLFVIRPNTELNRDVRKT